nr:EpsG family protein [uncultured Sphingomonas sp.]
MLPYWILFLSCAIFAVGRIDFHSIEARNRTGLSISLLLIALMIGLRFQVGGDYGSYEQLHRELAGMEFRDAFWRTDPGYGLIDWAAGQFGLGTWVVNLACAGIFCWGLGQLLRSNPNPFLGLAVAVPYLIIVVAMGYTRQSAALGFIMAGLAHFDRSRVLRFAAMCLLAVLFHKSAIVMLPVGLLALNHNRLVSLGLLIALGGLIYYVFVAASVDRLVNNYVTQAMSSQGAMVRILMSVPPALLLLGFAGQFRFTEDQRRLYRNFAIGALAGFAAVLIGFPSTPVDRLALYILPLQLVVMTRLVALFPVDARSAATFALGIVALYGLVQYVWLNYAVYSTYWIPYRFLPFN